MTVKLTTQEKMDDAVKSARQIIESAKGRDLTAEETGRAQEFITAAQGFKSALAGAAESREVLRMLSELGGDETGGGQTDQTSMAKSLGDHFVKSGAFGETVARKGVQRFTAGTTDYKAAPTPIISTGLGQVQYGGVVETPLRRATIEDLMPGGTLAGTSLTYFQQGVVTGDFGWVLENGEKPPIDFAFSPVTEVLAKIAGVTKLTDETAEDAPAVASIINGQLTTRLVLGVERGLMTGTGTAPQLRGLYNRSGVQTEAAADAADNADAIYRAMTKIQTATELTADGLVIHPVDYQRERLAKDANGQYLGGGPFTGPYGNGAVLEMPSLWGLRTIVTTAATLGTPIVGAFGAAAQVFTKGGIRVESTNSDGDDFRFNRIAIRAEVRKLLAVYIPAAFVVVTLSAV